MDEIYEILEHDTLSKLAEKFNMSEQEIMDLNPDYRGFISHPSGEMIYEGDTLNIKKQKPAVKAFSLLKDKLRKGIGIKGDKKFKETLVGELFGGGQPFKETGVGKALGGGKPIGETKVGGALGFDKPFKETAVGRFLGGGKPIKDTGIGRFFNPNETPVLDAIFDSSNKRGGGGLIQKYDEGGIFDRLVSEFGETELGEWMGSEEGQEGLDEFSSYLQKSKEPEERETEHEIEKERLEALVNQKTIQGSDVVNYASAAGKVASGNIPGAILDVGKTYIDIFGRKKEKKKAQKELDKLEKREDLGFLGNVMGGDIQQQYSLSLEEDALDSRLSALEKYGTPKDEDISAISEEDYSMPAGFMKRGGTVNPDAFPFLSDSYKRYLSGQYALGGEIKRKRPEHLKYDYASGGVVKLENGGNLQNPITMPLLNPIAHKTEDWTWSGLGHGILDALGMIPGPGEAADALNAAWYAGEGDLKNAAISSTAAIPGFVGWGATLSKLGKHSKNLPIPKWSKGVPHHGKYTPELAVKSLNDLRDSGKYLDNLNYDFSKLSAKNMIFHGDRGGRSLVEIALPGGKPQMFYKSTSKHGGAWMPYGGEMTKIYPPGHQKAGQTYEWMSKGTQSDIDNFYGSQAYRDIGGQLDRIAAEEGWDMSKQIQRKLGGMVHGKSHKNGGEKFNVGGEVVELEGGEAVINKKSTEMFRPILSKMNEAGGGTSFARGGLVNPNVNRMIQRLMNKNR